MAHTSSKKDLQSLNCRTKALESCNVHKIEPPDVWKADLDGLGVSLVLNYHD